ncbi:OmpA/MotB family protein [Arenibacter troitsensis]|uniref:Chemotaxis protein MotB n=1 Tax=Arenibacter troitsensis TaxID=188872 RepID=A0A1X7JXI7_9FLAO|nr:OmpA family protein [Arenibacter troitsensis]SMG33195.1 chemotaxis protein MotB [Arenibacter troitsensis]
MKTLYLYVLALILFSSCVSQKKYTAMQNRAVNCENELNTSKNQINLLEAGLANEKNRSKSLEQQMEYFKSTNTDLLARLSDLSVVSKSGAESIKKSLEALNEQNKYIKDLTSSIQRKDSINLVLVMNLKRSLDNFEDEDINIEVKKGVVYVSISDKMLFRSGSYNISSRAEEVIGKIAKIINDHKELDILVEGHTDNVPISTECMVDNWDLSVKRATSIVRLMQTKFAVQPIRMTAGGRSEYLPKTTNATAEGRAVNRRTEIIILPKLDQFFELLEPPTTNMEGQGKG